MAFHFEPQAGREDRQAMHYPGSLKRCGEHSIRPLPVAVTNLQPGNEMQRPLEYQVARKWIQSQLAAIFRHLETKFAKRRLPLPSRPVVVRQDNSMRRGSSSFPPAIFQPCCSYLTGSAQ